MSRGIHYTPTFYINGVKATQVDSTTTVQQWIQILGKSETDINYRYEAF